MFEKSRKEKFVGQAQDLAHDLTEAIAPHVEKARDEIVSRTSDARDTLAPHLADARDAVAARTSDARDAVAPRFADARDAVAPRFADARDAVAPHVETARDRLVNGVVPSVQQAVSDAREQAGPVAEEARRRGVLAAAALKGEQVQPQPTKKGGKARSVLLVAALAGAGAFIAKKLTSGGGNQDNWQSSYTPTPAAPTAASSAAPSVGATPGEALADSTEAPHPVTTPDAPAETVHVTEDPKP